MYIVTIGCNWRSMSMYIHELFFAPNCMNIGTRCSGQVNHMMDCSLCLTRIVRRFGCSLAKIGKSMRSPVKWQSCSANWTYNRYEGRVFIFVGSLNEHLILSFSRPEQNCKSCCIAFSLFEFRISWTQAIPPWTSKIWLNAVMECWQQLASKAWQ